MMILIWKTLMAFFFAGTVYMQVKFVNHETQRREAAQQDDLIRVSKYKFLLRGSYYNATILAVLLAVVSVPVFNHWLGWIDFKPYLKSTLQLVALAVISGFSAFVMFIVSGFCVDGLAKALRGK